MVVVAMTLVSEARSKIVCVVAAGADGANVNLPSAFNAISFPARVIATEAHGNAFAAIASSSTAKARENTSSWLAVASITH